MRREDRIASDDPRKLRRIVISRRLALGSWGLAALGVLPNSGLGQTHQQGAYVTAPPGAKPPKEIQERMEKSKAFSERFRNAKGQEEHWQILNELLD